MLEPIEAQIDNPTEWLRRPFALRLASAWGRYSPRGKGWVPQAIGKRIAGGGGEFRGSSRTRRGAVLAVDPRSLDVYCAIERLGGTWEPNVYDVLQKFLKPDDVFIDVGANVGYMTIELSKALNGQIDVFAFEPQPSLARTVATSARLNGFGRVTVFSAMVGKSEGTGTLYVPAHSLHASSVSAEPGTATITVPVITIDAMMQRGQVRPPDVMKIDVEGAERDVFEGAAETIRQHQPYLMFESNFTDARFGYSRRDLCKYISTLGDYEFFGSYEGQLLPFPQYMEDPRIADVAAIPARRGMPG